MTRSLAMFVALALWGVLGTVAEAKPKVALTPIDGDTSGEMGDAVVEALDGKDLDVIAPTQVTRAVDKLGFDTDLNDKQAKKVAAELEADALLFATLDRKGFNKVLKFRIYVKGKKARGFTVTFNNPRSDRFKVMLRDKLVQKLEDESEPKASKGDDEDDDEPKKKKKKKKKASKDDDEEPSEDEDEDIDAAVRRVSPHTANRVAVRLDVGVSVQNRSLLFTSRKTNFPQAPNPYRNAPVPGARFEAELYPFAFANPKSPGAWFGFAAEYDKTISLTLRTSDEPNVPVEANQQHWSVGARLRIPFGRSGLAPTVTLGADFGYRRFTTDRSKLMDPASLDVPDTNYKMLSPGLALRIPIVSVLALTLGGKAGLVLDAGPIQRPNQYGQAKVFGGSAEAGIDIVLGNRFAIRIVGEFSQFGFAFVGNGAMSNARDGDPMSKDVGGAADRSVGGSATLAVLY